MRQHITKCGNVRKEAGCKNSLSLSISRSLSLSIYIYIYTCIYIYIYIHICNTTKCDVAADGRPLPAFANEVTPPLLISTLPLHTHTHMCVYMQRDMTQYDITLYEILYYHIIQYNILPLIIVILVLALFALLCLSLSLLSLLSFAARDAAAEGCSPSLLAAPDGRKSPRSGSGKPGGMCVYVYIYIYIYVCIHIHIN